ncbi:MAG: glycerol-3-phosphate 1-O-acyltransferase PlsY [Rickettsiales bacterium]
MPIETLIIIILAYFIGSIPFGLILTKLIVKKDLRSLGSGNIGATNVVRAAGKKLGGLAFFLDASKAIFAIYLAAQFGLQESSLIFLIGLMAIIGHCFPIWLKFKGGKGVATYIGMIFVFDPFLTLFIIGGWYIVFYITQIVSLASILIMCTIIFYFLFKFEYALIYFIIGAIIVIFRHKENLQRLLKGEENNFKNDSKTS